MKDTKINLPNADSFIEVIDGVIWVEDGTDINLLDELIDALQNIQDEYKKLKLKPKINR